TMQISWTTQNIPANAVMNINLSNENGMVGQIVTGLNPNTTTSYSWNTSSPIGTASTINGLVPEYAYPGQYKIDLEAYLPMPVTADNEKGMSVVRDLSDDYFTLTLPSGQMPAAPSISSLSLPSVPNDGTALETLNGSGFSNSTSVYFSNSTYPYAYKTTPSSV